MVNTQLLLFLLLGVVSSFALGETFKGLLIPADYGEPVPIVIELARSAYGISGKVTTSFPHTGRGPITHGKKSGDICDVRSNINTEVTIALRGTCTSSTFNGKYTMFFHNQTQRMGIFRLREVPSEKTTEKNTESGARKLASTTVTMCLKSNTTCLTSCPRDDYNAQFLCTMKCKHKLASCKAEGKKLRQAGSTGFDEPDLGTSIR